MGVLAFWFGVLLGYSEPAEPPVLETVLREEWRGDGRNSKQIVRTDGARFWRTCTDDDGACVQTQTSERGFEILRRLEQL